MKLTKRGFTLVELMIVIAIIGILAASLFPSLTAYLKRSRDAARIAHLKDITTALGAFYSDDEWYPLPVSSGCLNSWALVPSYIPLLLVDPTANRNNGCGANGNYGYAVWTWYANSPQFLVSSVFENDNGGNYSNVTGTGVSTIVGTGIFDVTERTALDVAGIVRKGNGSGYLIYK